MPVDPKFNAHDPIVTSRAQFHGAHDVHTYGRRIPVGLMAIAQIVTSRAHASYCAVHVVLIHLPIQRLGEFTLHRSEDRSIVWSIDYLAWSVVSFQLGLQFPEPATHGGPRSDYLVHTTTIPVCMQYISRSEGREHHQAVCSSRVHQVLAA